MIRKAEGGPIMIEGGVDVIGTVGEAPKPYIVNNNFFNVPESAIDDDTLRNIGHTNPQQYFTKG